MSMPPRIALVTCADLPLLAPDDRLAADALRARGAEVTPAVWNDPAVRWDAFDHLVIRSPWDYHHQAGVFARWLDDRETSGVRMSNAYATLRWNMEKTYLRELERRGLPIVPTVWIERGAPLPLAAVLSATGWERVVVKPTVSASAHNTWIVGPTATQEDEERSRRLAADSGVMVQRFMGAIEHQGEWSLVYLGGTYSHAVVKRPARGDFRVQEEYGGSVEPADPPQSIRGAADAVMAAVPKGALYARVDGVMEEGAFVLMELEALEPSLYFREGGTAAAGRFAEALLAPSAT